ncbi:hypothetical protein [Variovorax guangxiensis]|uniref:hypothetical protein n=1 Tax=Variovorax guangxiensis TaxID=1775474 RepID=UPI00285AD25B|nr:hypothetical protein [Variovorax guangxiensis]MDR6855562.1 hypothetical protein [Variovorax guangxiensis]
MKQRRNNTRIAIWKFANGVGASDLASKMREQMNSDQELTGADIKGLLAVKLPSEMPRPNRTLDDELEFLDMRNGTIEKDNDEGEKESEHAVFNFFSDIKKYMNVDPAQREQADNEDLVEVATIWDKANSSQMMFPGNASDEADKIYAITKSFLDKEMNSPSSFPNGREIFAAAGVPERTMALTLNVLLITARKGNPNKTQKCAEELKLDLWLANLKTAASLFINEAYLRKIPEDRRVEIGIAGHNMAKLAAKFEDPAGQYQAVRRLVEEGRTSPDAFVQLVRRNLGTIDQPIKKRAARHVDTQVRRANFKSQQRKADLKGFLNANGPN